ncbi:MAG: ketoacyl-ACP synthase III [Limnochordia bacterium]|nr:ketoacyl-ACP synthase III [Limnochordia bacterium]
MKELIRSAGILGTGRFVPERVLTNEDLEKMVDTSDEWITTRTGIKERRIAEPEQASSDLAILAARAALKDANIRADQLDLVIVATVTPDHAFPSTASILQNKLGATKAAAYDLAAGCSGFVYGLTAAATMIEARAMNHVLVVGVETLSKIVDWTDRSTCVLFGDGAGAAVLGPVPEGYGILSSVLGSDGSGAELLVLEAGGSRNPASLETVQGKRHTISMHGNEVFKFAVRIMDEASLNVLKKAGLSSEDIDLFIPHQANIRIIDAAARRLQLPEDRVFVNVDAYGNTSAASIAIALDEARKKGRIQSGDFVLLVGFGAGLTWGAAIVRWY